MTHTAPAHETGKILRKRHIFGGSTLSGAIIYLRPYVLPQIPY